MEFVILTSNQKNWIPFYQARGELRNYYGNQHAVITLLISLNKLRFNSYTACILRISSHVASDPYSTLTAHIDIDIDVVLVKLPENTCLMVLMSRGRNRIWVGG